MFSKACIYHEGTPSYFNQWFNYKIFPDKIRALSTINFQKNPAAEYDYEAKKKKNFFLF